MTDSTSWMLGLSVAVSIATSASPLDTLGQSPLRETPVTASPIEQAQPEAYQPCGDPPRAGLCLPERISEVERVSAGQFESDGGASCRLVYPSEPRPEEFVCGELLVGLRPRIDWMAIRAVREAANGEWVRIEGDFGASRHGTLRVEPGTERGALRNIIFHPMVMWVEFNHMGAIPLGR